MIDSKLIVYKMVKKTRKQIGKKLSKGLMKDLFGTDESEDEVVGNNNSSPCSNKPLLKQKTKSFNKREAKITVINPVQEIQILAVNKSSKSPLRPSSYAQNPQSETLPSSESGSKKDEFKYLSYKLVKSSKRQLTQDLFDSSCSSELEPTTQKPWRRTKKEHADPSGSKKGGEHANPSGPRKVGEHANPSGTKKVEHANPSGTKKVGEHANPSGPRKEGEHANPSGPRKEGEHANPSGPRKEGEHANPSGPRKEGEHANPSGPRKEGEHANPSGPRKEGERTKTSGFIKVGEHASSSGPRKLGDHANSNGPSKGREHTIPSGLRKEGEHANPRGPRKVREKDCPGSNGPGKVKEHHHSNGFKSEKSTMGSVKNKKIKVPSNDIPQKFSIFGNEKSSLKVNCSVGEDSKKNITKSSMKKYKNAILKPSPQSRSDSATKAEFSFSIADKEIYAERKKTKKILELKTESIEPKLGSSVFEYIEDDETAKIRKKLEKQALNKEIKARLKQKERKSNSKSLLHNTDRSSQSEAEESNPTPAKKFRKSKAKPREKTQEKSDTLDSKFIDEMFQLIGSPSGSDPGWDDIEHEFDANLEEDIRKIDEYLEAARVEEVEYQKYLLENTGFRNRLETELTEPVLRKLFNMNLQFFKDIWSGKGKSVRHDQYARGGADRQELRFSMITDPYTELQLDWVLDEISKVWMRNAEERRDNNDYVWKVLLPEVFIKLYMDHFSMEKGEAEKRIRNTPLREEDDF